MYELIQISEHDYYIDCPAKIGLVRFGEKDVVAIDSGNDKDAGKKLLRHIEAMDWKLSAIFNTHSHADHIGGNNLIQERTGCKVYAPGLEAVYTAHPELEPMTLWGGMPFNELKNKFLMAKTSRAEMLTEAVLPSGMSIITLPGHCFDMVGYRTADNNVFLADCLSSEETLAKYGIGYLWNPGAYIESLEMVKSLKANMFIPSHAPAQADIAPLAQLNIDAVRETMAKILELLSEPRTFEDVLQGLFSAYNLTMSAGQYALIGSTLRSYLSYLITEGKIGFAFEDNRMVYSCAKK